VDFNKCPCSGKSLARLLQPALMSVLAGEPLHGYLIAQRLRKLALFQESPPDYAGIYRVLNSMEEQGFVKGEWDTAEAGPAKRCYALTSQGRSCMAKWLKTLKGYRRAIDDLTAVLESRVSKRKATR
jgi:DNA-binding PadR family transcriptional regulator